MKVYINCETECDINKRSYDALGGLAGLSKTWFQHGWYMCICVYITREICCDI